MRLAGTHRGANEAKSGSEFESESESSRSSYPRNARAAAGGHLAAQDVVVRGAGRGDVQGRRGGRCRYRCRCVGRRGGVAGAPDGGAGPDGAEF